jgi:hypothetical protein
MSGTEADGNAAAQGRRAMGAVVMEAVEAQGCSEIAQRR